jgi:hypothetical protein
LTKVLLSPPLQVILAAELARGNSIREVSDFPPDCRVFVLLNQCFKRRYSCMVGVTYSRLDDRNYWREEYRLDELGECLAGPF